MGRRVFWGLQARGAVFLHWLPRRAPFFMHTDKFTKLMERCRAVKAALFETPDNHPIASLDPNLASKVQESCVRNVRPTRSGEPHRSAAAGERTTEQLLAELNSIQNPQAQTVWWKQNYEQVKLAQWREAGAQGGQTKRRPAFGRFANISHQKNQTGA